MSGDDSKSAEETTGALVVKSGEVKEIVSSSPYTLSGSDNPGALITPVMLTGDNYNL